MKAEELRSKIKSCLNGNYLVTGEQLDALEKLMQDYAKQEAIQFNKWVDKTDINYYKCPPEDRPDWLTDTEQLYQKFKDDENYTHNRLNVD